MNWFYKNDGTEIGPLSESTIRELQAAGVLNADTLVRAVDSAEWIDIAKAIGQAAVPDSLQQSLAEHGASKPPELNASQPPIHPVPPHMAGGNKTFSPESIKNFASVLLRMIKDGIAAIQRFLQSEKTKQTLEKVKEGAHHLGEASYQTAKKVATSDAAKASVRYAKQTADQVRSKVTELAHSESRQTPPHIPSQAHESPPLQQATGPSEPVPQPAPVLVSSSSPSKPRRRFDWRFAIGIIVAVGCTGMIIGAINGSKGNNGGSGQSSSGSRSSYRSPCGRCGGSGQLVGQCTKCYGAGTIMSRGANYDGIQPYSQPVQMPCPQCRGGGQMPVPCNRCKGSGIGPY